MLWVHCGQIQEQCFGNRARIHRNPRQFTWCSFIHKTLISHSFCNSLTLFFFRHNNLVEIAWSFIKWLTFSIILMISIKKTKHPISCHGSLCVSSLNLIVFLWWKCLQIKQLLALLLVVILQSTFIAQPPCNYFWEQLLSIICSLKG